MKSQTYNLATAGWDTVKKISTMGYTRELEELNYEDTVKII